VLHQVGKLESLMEKPVAIVKPNRTVFDPFMSSATTGIAALLASHHL
jgi:DNA modification methylase